MSGERPSDDQIIAEIADALARELKKVLYPREYFESIMRLKAPTEKLVYLYIWLTQPQTFGSVKRGLNLSSTSTNRAVKSLLDKGLIVKDKHSLYWTGDGAKDL
jgi:predicted transcriptional regulator